MLRELAQQNKIIVLSSQDMAFADLISDRVLIVRAGALVTG